jgi:cell fate regulator YaaT (PSP1 superfamily)
MKIAQIQFAPWDKVYNFGAENQKVKRGDYVVVETELGEELGKVLRVDDRELRADEVIGGEKALKSIKRLATLADLNKMASQDKKNEALDVCREYVAKRGLDIKLVDVSFSFVGNRLNFAFIADGRVDFRDLVKDLTSHFNAQIRLTQIGTRDEARFSGDCGPCGKVLCCKGHIREFFSITSDMAEAQQVVHRGSERISGMCGRLMCCLSFEYEGYKEMAGNLPPIGTKVNVDGARGVVVGHHILKQSVDVKFPGAKEGERDFVIQVDINRHQKKAKAEHKAAEEKAEADRIREERRNRK